MERIAPDAMTDEEIEQAAHARVHREAESVKAEMPKPVPKPPEKLHINLTGFIQVMPTIWAAKEPTITLSKGGKINISASAVRLAPEEAQKPNTAALFVHPNGKIIAIRPSSQGQFRISRSKNHFELSGRAVIGILVKNGIASLPIKYQAEWDDVQGAWVGRLA